MPKKKKSVKKKTRGSAKKEAVKQSSGFGLYAFAVILLLAAILLFIGGFNTGGKLPVGMFHGFYWLFGLAAYIVPFGLIAIAIMVFLKDDQKLRKDRLFSIILSVLAFSGLAYVAFANKDTSGNWLGGHGGHAGSAIGGALLSSLDKIPAILVFLLIAVLAATYAAGITVKELFKLLVRTKVPEEVDTDLESLKNNVGEGSFKINEGVPIEHDTTPADDPVHEPTRIGSFKNTAQKLATSQPVTYHRY